MNENGVVAFFERGRRHQALSSESDRPRVDGQQETQRQVPCRTQVPRMNERLTIHRPSH